MYLTPIEAQKRYGYHRRTLSRWADDGKIDFIFCGVWGAIRPTSYP